MDRKAFRNCGAVLASLGAVLSAGCGAQSANPVTAAPTASLPVASEVEQRAVVVGRAEAEAPLEGWPADAEFMDDVVGTPIEVVAIEPEPSDLSITAVAAIEELDTAATAKTDSGAALDAPTSYAQALDPEPVATPMESVTPTESEIRFSTPADEAADSKALEVDRSHGRIAKQARQTDQGKRGLMPVMVTPRATPEAEQALDSFPTTAERQPASQPGSTAEGHPAATEPSAAAAPTPLPPVRVAPSPAMAAAMARVQERVRHGIRLADKGALYASRKEFTAAVKMIGQAHDVEQVTRRHTRAVVNGFVALKEADDFVRQNANLGVLNVERLVSGHKTPLLKDEDVTDMPPTVAAGYYFNYAKDQLAEAVGRETIGSIALYGLGKIIVAGAGSNTRQLEYTGPAIALFQAALICEPDNFRAEHELGVLLAGNGQLELARQMLISSVGKSPQPAMWQNLAKVHARMGERQLAQRAQQNAQVLEQANPKSKAPPVEWVDPATFSRTVSVTDPMPQPPIAPTNQTTSAKSPKSSAKSKAKVAKKRPNRWDPRNLRR